VFWLDPLVCAELFALANLAFLGVDIALAHAVNGYAHPAEWIPLGFSASATAVLLFAQLLRGFRPGPDAVPAASGPSRLRVRIAGWLGILVGWSSIFLGVLGLLFHLKSQFFALQTIKSLVYAAPFAAPLAYTGIGLLILLNRMVPAGDREWGWWVVALAMFGFAGNFVLCLTDHAQNGFFRPTEWIGVVAAAYATAALVAVMLEPGSLTLRRFAGVVLAAAGCVGFVGGGLHLMGNLRAESVGSLYQRIASGDLRADLESGRLRDAFLYGAPAFAPLLFVDLAVLAALGLWGLARARAPHSERARTPAHALRG
jgi:hypothetical protein